jgi:hypothetical protein
MIDVGETAGCTDPTPALTGLCLALREHGILIASHAQGCVRNKVYPTVVDRAAGCTCCLEEIQTTVRVVLNIPAPTLGDTPHG